MRTESSHLNQNAIKALAGLLFLYTCVWEKTSFRIVFRNYFLSLYIIFVSSTSLPGGNQVDGLPPVAFGKTKLKDKFVILSVVLASF